MIFIDNQLKYLCVKAVICILGLISLTIVLFFNYGYVSGNLKFNFNTSSFYVDDKLDKDGKLFMENNKVKIYVYKLTNSKAEPYSVMEDYLKSLNSVGDIVEIEESSKGIGCSYKDTSAYCSFFISSKIIGNDLYVFICREASSAKLTRVRRYVARIKEV